MEEIIAVLNKSNIIVKSKDNIYQLIIPAKVNENLDIEYKIYIENNDKGYKLTDKKNILKSMNEIYELSSNDVKQCINDVLKFYNFSLVKGEIFCEITKENCLQRLFNLIQVYSQLINMFIFFNN